MNKKRFRKFRLFSDRRAVSPAISSVIMAGAIIIVGFSVLAWTYGQSSNFNSQYTASMRTNLDKLGEKVVVEYVFYNGSNRQLSVYLLNCGETAEVNLASATLRNSSWHQSFSNMSLMYLNNTAVQSLNVNEEGLFRLPSNLTACATYSLSFSTSRGKSFVTEFVA